MCVAAQVHCHLPPCHAAYPLPPTCCWPTCLGFGWQCHWDSMWQQCHWDSMWQQCHWDSMWQQCIGCHWKAWVALPPKCNAAPCHPNGMPPQCNAAPCHPNGMPPQCNAAPCHHNAMPPHMPSQCYAAPCLPNGMLPQWHVTPMQCNPMLPHAALIPCHPMPSKFHAATSPSAHPSILYHSLPLMLVLNAIHCPLAHLYTVCNQYSINPSPYIIHPPAHPSALVTAHTSAHPSAMATIYPMGPFRMAPSGT